MVHDYNINHIMKHSLISTLILLAAGMAGIATAGNISAQEKNDFATKSGRMDRSRMNIGVYHLRPYARTEAHIKDLAECGVDFVICMENDRPALDLFQKYGVGAILSGIVPGWWGGMGDNAGTLKDVYPLGFPILWKGVGESGGGLPESVRFHQPASLLCTWSAGR